MNGTCQRCREEIRHHHDEPWYLVPLCGICYEITKEPPAKTPDQKLLAVEKLLERWRSLDSVLDCQRNCGSYDKGSRRQLQLCIRQLSQAITTEPATTVPSPECDPLSLPR